MSSALAIDAEALQALLALPQQIAELQAEVRELRAELQQGEEEPPFADEVVIGYRRAAEVLGVGRESLRKAVMRLPLHQRPAMVAVQGGKQGPWWETGRACVAWWREVHAPPSRRTRPSRAHKAPIEPLDGRGQIEAGWDALMKRSNR